eukprot:gene57831-biopygen36633
MIVKIAVQQVQETERKRAEHRAWREKYERDGGFGAETQGLQMGTEVKISEEGMANEVHAWLLPVSIAKVVGFDEDGDPVIQKGDGKEAAVSREFVELAAKQYPAELHVRSPNWQQQCAGRYTLIKEQRPNGCPLWRHDAADLWLYSGTDGKCDPSLVRSLSPSLYIGTKWASQDVFNGAFGCGWVSCPTPHGGRSPHEMAVGWRRYDDVDKKWIDDGDIAVTVAAAAMTRGKGKDENGGGGGDGGKGEGRGDPSFRPVSASLQEDEKATATGRKGTDTAERVMGHSDKDSEDSLTLIPDGSDDENEQT